MHCMIRLDQNLISRGHGTLDTKSICYLKANEESASHHHTHYTICGLVLLSGKMHMPLSPLVNGWTYQLGLLSCINCKILPYGTTHLVCARMHIKSSIYFLYQQANKGNFSLPSTSLLTLIFVVYNSTWYQNVPTQPQNPLEHMLEAISIDRGVLTSASIH